MVTKISNQRGYSSLLLTESKADQQKLIDYVGEDTAKLFFTLKDRLKSPENDIYYWLKKDPTELKGRLSELQSIQTRSQKEDKASEGAELIYNKDGWKVYHITTYEASAKYGKNTKWCIAGSKVWSNGEKGEEYFNDYTSKGVEFYFYIKDGAEKYALALTPQNGNYQVFNAEDDDITNDDLDFIPNVDGLPRLNSADAFDEDGYFIYDGNRIPYKLKLKVFKVKFDDSVTSIGDGAFSNCTSLESITIPDGVTSIGKMAFYDCQSLRSITIPDSVTSIGESVFYKCTSLKSITIPDGVTSIDMSAFSNCRLLEAITIPDSVTRISDFAFSYCTSLESITIPDSVIRIGGLTFSHCESLESITIPNSVTRIGYGAFFDCTSLESITIPDSVTEIGDYAFAGCPDLMVYTDNEYVIDYCDNQIGSIPHRSLSDAPLTESLTEASRKSLRSKSQRESPKRYAKRLNYYISNFKGVDLRQLFENDYFVFATPIKDYICTLAFPGVLTRLKDTVKDTDGNPRRINLRMVIQALREAFDATDDVKVRCTCPDFKYRFMHYAWRFDYLYGDPTPGTEAPPDITNPENNIGAVCKHLDLFLANKRWLVKAASTVNALIRTYPDKAALYLYDDVDVNSDEIVKGAFAPYDRPIDGEKETEETPQETETEEETTEEESEEEGGEE